MQSSISKPTSITERLGSGSGNRELLGSDLGSFQVLVLRTRFAPEWKHSRDEASRNGYSQNQPSMKNQPFPIDGNWPAANAWMKGVDSGKALTSD